MPTEHELRREAHSLNYQLRSTFFYRKLKEYKTLSFPARVAELFPHSELYNWAKRSDWHTVQTFIKQQRSEIVPFEQQTADTLLSEIEEHRGVMLTKSSSHSINYVFNPLTFTGNEV